MARDSTVRLGPLVRPAAGRLGRRSAVCSARTVWARRARLLAPLDARRSELASAPSLRGADARATDQRAPMHLATRAFLGWSRRARLTNTPFDRLRANGRGGRGGGSRCVSGMMVPLEILEPPPSPPRRRNAPASGLRSDRRDCASSAGASPTDRTATGGTPRFRNLEEPPRGGPHGVAGGERAWRDDPPTETSLARGAPGVAEPRSRHAEAPRPFPKAGTRRRLPSGPGAGPRGARGRAVRRSRATPSIRRCERGEAGSARAGPRRSPLAVMHAALPEGGPATRPSPGWRAASPRPAWGGRS